MQHPLIAFNNFLLTLLNRFVVLDQLPPRKIAPPPQPQSKANPNPNPNINRGAIFLEGNCLLAPPNPKTNPDLDPNSNPNRGQLSGYPVLLWFLGYKLDKNMSREALVLKAIR